MTDTVIEVGHGELNFCAAHTGRHPDGYEALHGHTFDVALRLCGELDDHVMVTDFAALKTAVRTTTSKLNRCTLVAAASEPPPGIAHGRVRFGDSTKHYDLPEADVVLLPVSNTTTEAIAAYLLDQVLDGIDPSPLAYAELILAESPGVAATVRRQLR